jgi:hypothetical protein
MQGVRTYVTASLLGLDAADSETINSILTTMDLDGVLGFLAYLSKAAVDQGPDFYSAAVQMPFLEFALSDNSHGTIPRDRQAALISSWARSVPVPPLVHPQSLAWLAHHAILCCARGELRPDFPLAFQAKMHRLLMDVNDHLSKVGVGLPSRSLFDRRRLGLDRLRLWQFSESFSVNETFRTIARMRRIYLDLLPHRFDVQAAFRRATGVELEVYFAFSYLVTSWLFGNQMARKVGARESPGMQGHWVDRSWMTHLLEANHDSAERVFGSWMVTPEEYVRRSQEIMTQFPDATSGFEFVQLKATPWIEVRPGAAIMPAAHVFLAKVVDEPYFTVANSEIGPRRQAFMQGLGDAYEEYANDLLSIIAQRDRSGAWSFFPNPMHGDDELADAILVKDQACVVFEHKALRPDTSFLLGGDGARVLGPNDERLRELDNGSTGAPVRGEDKGLVTRGMYQQSRSGPRVLSLIRSESGQVCQQMTPVLTHLARIRVDTDVFHVYIEELIRRQGLYSGEPWTRPIWMCVEDLELLNDLASAGTLDLKALIAEHVAAPLHVRFDILLADHVNRNRLKRSADWIEAAHTLLNTEAARLFFPVSSRTDTK